MNPIDALVQLLRDPDAAVEECLLLVAAATKAEPTPPHVSSAMLDHLALQVGDPSPAGVAAHLFGPAGFVGDVKDYHAPQNSWLDDVLQRRAGMPITLAAVLIAVGRRCGVGLHGVGMPGHFLVGVDGESDRFLDPFGGGVELGLRAAEARFRSIFGPGPEFGAELLKPVSTRSIVSRVLNNLTRSLADRDPSMLDPLIDLRAALPGPPSERRLVIGLAEARGRWDVAARIREELDPDDPAATALRARLN